MPTSSRVQAQASHAAIFAIMFKFRVGAGFARPPEAVSILQTVSLFGMIKNLHPSVGSRRAVTGMAFPCFENARRFMEMPANFTGSCTRAGNARPYAAYAFRRCIPAGRCGHRPLRRAFGRAFCGRAMPAPTRRFRILKMPARGHGAPWPYGQVHTPMYAVALRVQRLSMMRPHCPAVSSGISA